MLTDTITWRPVAPESMPDADLVVNVAIVGSEEPVWLGAFDGEVWRDTEGMQIDVTHWAPMLAGPAGVPLPAAAFREGNWQHPDGGRIVGWHIPAADAERMGADAYCLPREVSEALAKLAAAAGVAGTQGDKP